MLRILYFVGLCVLLTACGKDESKLPQECLDMIDAVNTMNIKLETNSYVPKALAEKGIKLNTEQLNTYTKTLSKSKDTVEKIQNCKIISSMYQLQINKLDKAKNEAEVIKILPYN